MSAIGTPSTTIAAGSGRGYRIGIIAAAWHADIVDELVNGATSTLREAGVEQSDILSIRVPGSYEIPVAARVMIDEGLVDAILAFGVVVRGETAHFEYVASPVAHGLMDLSVESGVPCLFGVLTTETVQQAWDRAGGAHGHKGVEAAQGALSLLATFNQLRTAKP